MSTIQALFILGITNIIFLILVLISCRCMGIWKLTKKIHLPDKLYRYHCLYWYGFMISVLAHTIIAFYLFGWPA